MDTYYKVPIQITVTVVTKAADAAAARTQALAYVQHQRVAKSTVHDEIITYAAGDAEIMG